MKVLRLYAADTLFNRIGKKLGYLKGYADFPLRPYLPNHPHFGPGWAAMTFQHEGDEIEFIIRPDGTIASYEKGRHVRAWQESESLRYEVLEVKDAGE